jgi:cysteine synthase
MDTAIVPAIYDAAVPDRTEFVATEEAEAMVRRLARTAGLLLGWSSGAAAVAAARLLAADPALSRPDAIVIVAPDSGQRYLSEGERLWR